MAIDMHAHYISPEVLGDLEQAPDSFPNIKLTRTAEGGIRLQFPGEPPTRPINPQLMELKNRKAWMAESGLTFQLMAGWQDIAGYSLPGEEAARWSRVQNKAMAAAVALEPELFAGLGTVPLQDGRLAAEELRVAHELGLKGTMIGTFINGMDLDEPSMDPFWAASAELQMPVVIHPVFGGNEERLAKYGMPNVIGRPQETVLAAANLIYGGVLERHPNLKVVLVHGGGYLPYQIGRLQRGWDADAAARAKCSIPPLEISKNLYYDHIVFHPLALRFLCDMAGVDKVLLGTDYPFGIGDLKPLKVVTETPLTSKEADAICQGNSSAIFRL